MQELNANNFRPAVFPADIMYDTDLKMSERMVMIVLYSYTNAHTNTAFPSYQTIADRAGITRRGAIDIVERLIIKGYIIKQENFRKSKEAGKIEQTSNLYTLSYRPRPGKPPKGGEHASLPPVNEVHHPSERASLPPVNEVHPNYPLLTIHLTEEEQNNFPQEYLELATEVGATEKDLASALKKMDSTPDIETPIAWLKKAIRNEVLNRELADRPKTPKTSTVSKVSKSMPKQSQATSPKKEKYEGFYL